MTRNIVHRTESRTLVVLGSALIWYALAGDRSLGYEAPHRNWTHHPAIVELDTTEAVFALGDIHGDYKRLVQLLFAGRLIESAPDAPKQAIWSGGKSVLICTGDLIDKWHHGLEVNLSVQVQAEFR